MGSNQQGRETLLQHGEQVQLLLGRLNEQQRRHVAGLLSLLLGRGGDSFLASQFGIDRRTLRKGKQELLDRFENVPDDRLRKPGGGCKPLEKKVPRSRNDSRKSSSRMWEGFRPANESGRD
jgi:hypothetical protein